MSVQALGWVLDHSPTEGSDRLVVISLANHAGQVVDDDDRGGDAWESWPGIATIQREARLRRERTVKDALARLVDAGHVVRVVNGAPDGRMRADRRTNLYRLLLSSGVPCGDTRCRWCGVTPDAARGDAQRHDGVTLGDATGVRDASPKPPDEPSEEPSGEPTGGELTLQLEIETPPAPTFVDFWAVYPRHVAKASAQQAWTRALNVTTAAVIIAGAAQYASEVADRDPGKIAHASSWLNGRRWEDPPGANTSGRAPRRGAAAPVTVGRTGAAGRVTL